LRTAEDLSYLLEKHAHEERRLSKAALETLAIIAYHQPVTRAEIEEIRGVSTSGGTLDILLETGWVRPRGRRRAPGKPITYGTTDAFLSHFGLDTVKDLPGLADLKAQGLLDSNLPPGFSVPEPTDVAALMPDELPLDADDDEEEGVVQAEMELDLPEEAEADKPEDGETDKTDEASS
jgi:segregation and condensation protein B